MSFDQGAKAGYAVPRQDVPPQSIGSRATELSDHMDTLVKRLEELRESLVSVLTPALPQQDANKELSTVQHASPHAEFLSGITSKLNRAHRILSDITDRLQL